MKDWRNGRSPYADFISNMTILGDDIRSRVRNSMGYAQFREIPKSRWDEFFLKVAAMEELEK